MLERATYPSLIAGLLRKVHGTHKPFATEAEWLWCARRGDVAGDWRACRT